jgi:quercetin dioxygenase-like cupin family protein
MDRNSGTDCSWRDLDIRTLLSGEQSGGRFSVHSLRLPPGAGLPPHYLTDSQTYIAVTEGEVVLRVGDLEETVPGFGVGYIPPSTRMAYRNRSAKPASLLLVQSPAGTERAFAETNRYWVDSGDNDEKAYLAILARFGFRFDDQLLPRDALTNAPVEPLEFKLRGEGDMERLRHAFEQREPVPRLVQSTSAEMTGKVTGQNFRRQAVNGDCSSGHAMLTLLSFLPGAGASDHHQPTEDELFYVFDGTLHMSVATEKLDLPRGAFAYAPVNCTHGLRNLETEETRFMALNSPAGHERALTAMREIMRTGATPEEIDRLAVACGFILHEATIGTNERA